MSFKIIQKMIFKKKKSSKSVTLAFGRIFIEDSFETTISLLKK